jgi:hypothetical protein
MKQHPTTGPITWLARRNRAHRPCRCERLDRLFFTEDGTFHCLKCGRPVDLADRAATA